MIVDKITNLSRYAYVPHVQKVIDFLNSNDITTIALGSYDLGDECKVKVMEYLTHEEPEEVLFEAHREFLDLQLLAKGEELFLTQAIELGDEAVPYKKDKDVEFFRVGYYNSLALNTENFAILFPNDLHIGNMNADGESAVKKLVFKLKI